MAQVSCVEKIEQFKIIPVLVLNDVESGLKRCEMLCRNGLCVAEITFRTEAAEAVIRAASKEFPEMWIGAGTVLNVKNQLIVTKTAVDGSYSITVSADPTYAGTASTVSFAPVKTKAVRLEVTLPDNDSAGLFEWSVR